MTTIKAFLNSHPLLSYFALTFAITWGLFVLAVGPGGIPATKEEFTTLPLGAILAVLVGPSVSGILLTGLLYGKAGLHDLFARMTKWRVGARWYAVALLTAPLLFTAVLIPLSLISPVFRLGIFASDAKVSFVLMGIVVALIVGIFEELGWTGFAVPTLLRLRYSVLATGLIVGVLWGAWHLLGNDIWASVAISGRLPPALFAVVVGLVLVVGQLPAYRMLMVWVYERTDGSLLLAMLMHASYSACTFILNPVAGPGAMSGTYLLAYVIASAAVTWVVVGVVALANHGHLSRRPPLGRRVA
jgi:membrane protease YdiL (CAAX protease family)